MIIFINKLIRGDYEMSQIGIKPKFWVELNKHKTELIPSNNYEKISWTHYLLVLFNVALKHKDEIIAEIQLTRDEFTNVRKKKNTA